MPLEKLQHDDQLVVDGTVAKSKLVTVCHEGEDVLPRHLFHRAFFIGRDEEFLQRVAVTDVGSVTALGFDHREVLVDSCRIVMVTPGS